MGTRVVVLPSDMALAGEFSFDERLRRGDEAREGKFVRITGTS